MDFERMLSETRVIPVVEIPRVEDAVPLARALVDGGLPCAEITFRTAAAGDAIAAISEALPEFTVGAGTVLSVRQAEEALAAGALLPRLAGVRRRRRRASPASAGVPMLPGVCTPSEIGRAAGAGARTSSSSSRPKPPAVSATCKAVAAPFGGVRFVPTGGIGPANLGSYLRHPQVIACGGSWMVKKQTIADGDFATIGRLAVRGGRAAAAAVA